MEPKLSQTKLIQDHLERGETITALEALRKYGCFRLASRINDLRRSGMDIQSRFITTFENKRVSEYYIQF